MEICIDFDGTCVTHEFPKIGNDIGAVPILKRLIKNGHRLILWTMRSHDQEHPTDVLNDAINWFKENDIPLYGINHNPNQDSWTDSPKAYAQLYIDDAALGCPITYDIDLSDRYFADWSMIEKILEQQGFLIDHIYNEDFNSPR